MHLNLTFIFENSANFRVLSILECQNNSRVSELYSCFISTSFFRWSSCFFHTFTILMCPFIFSIWKSIWVFRIWKHISYALQFFVDPHVFWSCQILDTVLFYGRLRRYIFLLNRGMGEIIPILPSWPSKNPRRC
jgi:hypothetical protein